MLGRQPTLTLKLRAKLEQSQIVTNYTAST